MRFERIVFLTAVFLTLFSATGQARTTRMALYSYTINYFEKFLNEICETTAFTSASMNYSCGMGPSSTALSMVLTPGQSPFESTTELVRFDVEAKDKKITLADMLQFRDALVKDHIARIKPHRPAGYNCIPEKESKPKIGKIQALVLSEEIIYKYKCTDEGKPAGFIQFVLTNFKEVKEVGQYSKIRLSVHSEN